jgi:hypothetical protein
MAMKRTSRVRSKKTRRTGEVERAIRSAKRAILASGTGGTGARIALRKAERAIQSAKRAVLASGTGGTGARKALKRR